MEADPASKIVAKARGRPFSVVDERRYIIAQGFQQIFVITAMQSQSRKGVIDHGFLFMRKVLIRHLQKLPQRYDHPMRVKTRFSRHTLDKRDLIHYALMLLRER
nr:hypothetical protein [Methylocystis bryophila]